MGYDDIFFLKNEPIVISHPTSPISVLISSDYPCAVLYTHNLPSPYLNPAYPNRGLFSGIAIECQYAPGGIHHKQLNWPLITPESPYHHQIQYKIKKDHPF